MVFDYHSITSKYSSTRRTSINCLEILISNQKKIRILEKIQWIDKIYLDILYFLRKNNSDLRKKQIDSGKEFDTQFLVLKKGKFLLNSLQKRKKNLIKSYIIRKYLIFLSRDILNFREEEKKKKKTRLD